MFRRYGFTTKISEVQDHLDSGMYVLFRKTQTPDVFPMLLVQIKKTIIKRCHYVNIFQARWPRFNFSSSLLNAAVTELLNSAHPRRITRHTYRGFCEPSEVRLEVESDAVDSMRQCNATEKQQHQDDVRKNRREIHNLHMAQYFITSQAFLRTFKHSTRMAPPLSDVTDI